MFSPPRLGKEMTHELPLAEVAGFLLIHVACTSGAECMDASLDVCFVRMIQKVPSTLSIQAKECSSENKIVFQSLVCCMHVR